MSERVLITGGGGFIGRRVTQNLLRRGYRVRILDSFVEQVHGPRPAWPNALADAETMVGDIRDADALRKALAGVDSVVHLAAEVGVGQSMYAIERYVSANDLGSAALLERLAHKPVRRVVVASSMSVYGEGLYRTAAGELHEDAGRDRAALESGSWECRDPSGRLTPVPP